MNMKMSKRLVAGAAALVALAALGTAQAATPVSFNVAGIQSLHTFGTAGNAVATIQLSPNAQVVGVSWDLSLFANTPSWLSEMQVVFSDTAVAHGATLAPGAGVDLSGSGLYTGTRSLAAAGLAFNVGANGVLRLEFSESLDDGLAPDGTWVSGTLTFEVIPVPEPSTYGLMALGLVAVGAAVRRRAAR